MRDIVLNEESSGGGAEGALNGEREGTRGRLVLLCTGECVQGVLVHEEEGVICVKETIKRE